MLLFIKDFDEKMIQKAVKDLSGLLIFNCLHIFKRQMQVPIAIVS